ncbi:MAG: efflux RND transporter periplasmic adaptor subunit [Ectothiorhodospiraceae bacterium]|nr:efflux RND transporter periplasmic adaptor subunit [Ectothiorhodospiraceae bacterium]
MNLFIRILLPVLVLGLGVAAGVVLMATGPEVTQRTPKPVLPVVEVMSVTAEDYQVVLQTQGIVTPRTQSTLIPEVAGRIIATADAFRNGTFFGAGDELFTIDPIDFQHAITIARADLARARLALQQEKALAEHALNDWEKLKRKQGPTDLTLHKPQVVSAEAEVAASEARLQLAEINLQRTHIRAPYAGRVLETSVDLGQYVSPGTVAATLYSVDAAEVRLPLTDSQLAFVTLPGSGHSAKLTLTARLGQQVNQWQGRLVRTEAAIDTASRQLFVVAQIDQPFQRRHNKTPLNIGQFVEADITGTLLKDVFVLPRQVVESDGNVLVLTADNHLQRRAVKVVLRKDQQVIVSAGLENGERISLTPMPFAREGMAVSVLGEDKRESKKSPFNPTQRRKDAEPAKVL